MLELQSLLMALRLLQLLLAGAASMHVMATRSVPANTDDDEQSSGRGSSKTEPTHVLFMLIDGPSLLQAPQ